MPFPICTRQTLYKTKTTYSSMEQQLQTRTITAQRRFLTRYISEDVYIIRGKRTALSDAQDVKIPIFPDETFLHEHLARERVDLVSNVTNYNYPFCPDCGKQIRECGVPNMLECFCGSLFEEVSEEERYTPGKSRRHLERAWFETDKMQGFYVIEGDDIEEEHAENVHRPIPPAATPGTIRYPLCTECGSTLYVDDARKFAQDVVCIECGSEFREFITQFEK